MEVSNQPVYPQGKGPDTHLTGGWVGPRAVPYTVVNRIPVFLLYARFELKIQVVVFRFLRRVVYRRFGGPCCRHLRFIATLHGVTI
jgi:hypothetical protein